MRRIRLAGQLAEPISHYTDGVEAGGFLYVSGMLPVDANGDLVGAGDVVRQAEQVLDNVGAPSCGPPVPPSTTSCGSGCTC